MPISGKLINKKHAKNKLNLKILSLEKFQNLKSGFNLFNEELKKQINFAEKQISSFPNNKTFNKKNSFSNLINIFSQRVDETNLMSIVGETLIDESIVEFTGIKNECNSFVQLAKNLRNNIFGNLKLSKSKESNLNKLTTPCGVPFSKKKPVLTLL